VIERILSVARKEVIQLRRDRRTLPLVLLAPVIQLLLFGYAATQDVRNVRLAVVDQSRTPVSREIIRSLASTVTFRVSELPDRRAIQQEMLASRASVGLVVPVGLERDLLRRTGAGLELFADGSNPNTAAVAAGYVQQIVGTTLQREVGARFPGRAPSPDIKLVPRVMYNPELTSRNYMVPGVLVMILMIMTTIMTSMAIVREFERGTSEQLAVTPIRSYELLAGKLLPYIAIGYIDILLVTAVATAWFRVPIHGSVLLLFLLSAPFLLSTLGIGILTSTIARTQQQSMMIAFFFMMPNTLLSGFMFPIENMPLPAQYLTYLIPGRYYMTMVRAIFLKGVGFSVLWPETVALILLGTALLGLAVGRYQSRHA
jgi:ABC-2 type transport system permease protein